MNNIIYQDIINKYVNYKKLETNLKYDVNKENIEKELEARFEIDYQIEDILKKLNTLQIYEIEKELSIVEFHEDKKRKIIFTYPIFEEKEQTKLQISSNKINIQGYLINIAYSHEIEIPIKKIENPKIKNRTRYKIKNFFGCELHLTKYLDPFTNKNKNHIEIEYNLDKLSYDYIMTPIKYIFDLMYVKSYELLSPEQILPVIRNFNIYLSKLKGNLTRKDTENINNNRLITFEDKPIPIKNTELEIVKTKNYFVTNKLNGTRYFLFIINNEFYLIGKTGSKISTIPTLVWKLFVTTKLKKDNIFILDGEYFDDFNDNNDDQKLYFAFDILYHYSTKDDNIINTVYDQRLNFLKKITDYLHTFSPVQMKYIRYGYDVYSVIKYMKNTFKDEWNYENDGLIFTPIKSLYNDPTKKTLKWKFDHHQSVDVLVKKTENNGYYKCFVGDYNNNIIQFTEYLLFSNTKLIENSIVEISFDRELKEFYLLRLRPDKEFPNFKTVAESFWIDIINPLPLSSLDKLQLIGNTNEWIEYRKNCANPEKKIVIQKIDKDSIVIDIGFGKGGDIQKYIDQGIKYIIGIEPDISNIKEFFRRYKIDKSNLEITDKIITEDIKINNKNIKITIINKSASDQSLKNILENILKDNKNSITVCMFFSLTYFFNPIDDFVKLINNFIKLNPKKIIGTVMDGEKTINFLNNYEWNKKQCGLDLQLISKKFNQIYISISESATVSGHYEYLFLFDRFKNYLFLFGYILKERKFFNFEKPENNLLKHFASLNSSFEFNLENPLDQKDFNLIDIIIKYNEKLGLDLDSEYFYNCINCVKKENNLTKDETNILFENLFNNKPIQNYSLIKTIETKDEKDFREFFILKN